MQETDARSLPAAAQEEKRRLAVKLRRTGKTYPEIAELVGVHKLTIGKWCRQAAAGGTAALASKKRGRRQGDDRTLTPEQEAVIQRKICDHTPDQLTLAFALWTRRAVKLLIKEMFIIDMPIRTVGEYLKRWGFTPQKPLKMAYEQRPARSKSGSKSSIPPSRSAPKPRVRR